MSNRIEVEHNGYKISWDENKDVWRSYEIDYEHAKLSAVRRKLDETDRAARNRTGSIEAYFMSYDDAMPCKVTRLGPLKRRWTSVGNRTEEVKQAWIVVTDRDGKNKRNLVEIDTLAPDTEEARERIIQLAEAKEALRRAGKAVARAREAIPRMAIDDLKSLQFEGKNEEIGS